jgi:hypothetical protein
MFPWSDVNPPAEPLVPLLVRNRLDRETDLIIQRTAWVVGSQAFLFSAYAVSLNGPRHGATAQVEAKARLLVHLIPWVSIVSLLLLVVTIGAGVAAWSRLGGHLKSADPAAHELEGGPFVRVATLAAPLLIPLAFLSTWVALLVR